MKQYFVFSSRLFFSLLSLIFAVVTPLAVQAEQFLYAAVCNPTQQEDVGRVIQGRIYLRLRQDPTVKNFSVSAKVKKVKNQPYVYVAEKDLISGLDFSFNPADLSLAIGGDAQGHACFAEALLTVKIKVERHSGEELRNEFTTPIRVPGAYATKSKIRVEGGVRHP